MNSAARFLGLATACAMLLIAGAVIEPASAQGQCKDDVVTAAGRAKFRPFTKTKELEGRGSAMADAVVNWQKEVREKYGEQWDSWSRAKGTNFECAPTKSGKIIGSSFIGCTISGRPCASGGSSRDEVVVERERDRGRDRDRDRNRDRDRDRDREFRDRDRRYGGWEVRAEERRYERAMAFQEYLAKQRRRAESRAYERVMAYQERLAHRRKRIAEWEQDHWDDRPYRRHGSYGRHGYGRYGYGRYASYRRYASYSRYRAHIRYRPYGRYCNCAPYREYTFVPRVYSYSYLSDYHCTEP